ncbi:MAG: NIL domain-containing protein [Chloroflexi bacterium]|nr:NIL domain-containing protein [Chloroflexota bacterium]
MIRRRIKLTFPPKLITEPVIYNMGKKFAVITNIRRANVEEKWGWAVLELDAEKEEEINKALEWAAKQGVRVEPITGDVVEG